MNATEKKELYRKLFFSGMEQLYQQKSLFNRKFIRVKKDLIKLNKEVFDKKDDPRLNKAQEQRAQASTELLEVKYLINDIFDLYDSTDEKTKYTDDEKKILDSFWILIEDYIDDSWLEELINIAQDLT